MFPHPGQDHRHFGGTGRSVVHQQATVYQQSEFRLCVSGLDWDICADSKSAAFWTFLVAISILNESVAVKSQFGEQPQIHRRAQLYALCQCIAFVGGTYANEHPVFSPDAHLLFRCWITCSFRILPEEGVFFGWHFWGCVFGALPQTPAGGDPLHPGLRRER